MQGLVSENLGNLRLTRRPLEATFGVRKTHAICQAWIDQATFARGSIHGLRRSNADSASRHTARFGRPRRHRLGSDGHREDRRLRASRAATPRLSRGIAMPGARPDARAGHPSGNLDSRFGAHDGSARHLALWRGRLRVATRGHEEGLGRDRCHAGTAGGLSGPRRFAARRLTDRRARRGGPHA